MGQPSQYGPCAAQLPRPSTSEIRNTPLVVPTRMVMRGILRCAWKFRLAPCSRRLPEMIGQAGEQAAADGRPDRGFDVVFRMRHHAEHVAALVDDAGDGID